MTKSSAVQVGVHQAKTHLSHLLRLVDGGQEVEILRGGKPVAKIVPLRAAEQREFGIDAGVFEVPDDFDAPLPDDIVAAFHR